MCVSIKSNSDNEDFEKNILSEALKAVPLEPFNLKIGRELNPERSTSFHSAFLSVDQAGSVHHSQELIPYGFKVNQSWVS